MGELLNIVDHLRTKVANLHDYNARQGEWYRQSLAHLVGEREELRKQLSLTRSLLNNCNDQLKGRI